MQLSVHAAVVSLFPPFTLETMCVPEVSPTLPLDIAGRDAHRAGRHAHSHMCGSRSSLLKYLLVVEAYYFLQSL